MNEDGVNRPWLKPFCRGVAVVVSLHGLWLLLGRNAFDAAMGDFLIAAVIIFFTD